MDEAPSTARVLFFGGAGVLTGLLVQFGVPAVAGFLGLSIFSVLAWSFVLALWSISKRFVVTRGASAAMSTTGRFLITTTFLTVIASVFGLVAFGLGRLAAKIVA